MAAATAAARDQNLVSSFAGDLSDAKVLSHSGVLFESKNNILKTKVQSTRLKIIIQIKLK